MDIANFLKKGNELFERAEMIAHQDKQPFVPEHSGALLPWVYNGTHSRTAYIEVREGGLEFLAESDPFGTDAFVPDEDGRYIIPLIIPHFKQKKSLTPAMFEGVVAFGMEALESVEGKRNDFLGKMSRNHRLIWEVARMGAITGRVLGPNGSIIRNWFNKLGSEGSPLVQTKKTVDWSSAKIRSALVDAKRLGEEKLGDKTADGWVGICGKNVMDAINDNTSFEKSVERFNDGSLLRTDNRGGLILASDIIVHEYARPTVAGINLIGPDDFYLCPKVDDMYNFAWGPGTGMSDLGSQGRPEYYTAEDLPHDGGVEIKGSTNPLAWVSDLEAIVKVEQE
ncbi:hypothetical protein ELI15_14150 [Rhizobium ruizarguesonis]|uniref:major capsid protein n=1 Tax=Rhizobium ruizarguesonis TaxID=2081791 RepID=UPI00103236A3|nr:major capsid protein [Rhizobium ruizarguesonis]TAW65432.1 hypothetical protein ELI15_14150 [Rhizobium ruizarguesonis]